MSKNKKKTGINCERRRAENKLVCKIKHHVPNCAVVASPCSCAHCKPSYIPGYI